MNDKYVVGAKFYVSNGVDKTGTYVITESDKNNIGYDSIDLKSGGNISGICDMCLFENEIKNGNYILLNRTIFLLTDEELNKIPVLSGLFDENTLFIIDKTDCYIEIGSNSDYNGYLKLYTDGSIICICNDDNSTRPYNGAKIMEYLFSLNIFFYE